MDTQTMPFITDKEIKSTLCISQPTLWRWTKNLGFPPPIEGMKGRRKREDVYKWIEEQGKESAKLSFQ